MKLGKPVAISADGNTIVAGATSWDATPTNSEGAIFIFTRAGGAWTQKDVFTNTSRTILIPSGTQPLSSTTAL